MGDEDSMMDIPWGESDDELINARRRFGILFETEPVQFKYVSFKHIYQHGPTCGITALAMCCGMSSTEQTNDIIEKAKSLNYTKKGEMFSVLHMCSLARDIVNKRVELFSGYLMCQKIINFLLGGGILLVPYDSDANNEPCSKNGYRAHWALISGIIMCELDHVYVLARQGKSKLLGLWSLRQLADSNAQLNEVAPKRSETYEYVIPEGGIAGENGLNKKSVMIYHSS